MSAATVTSSNTKKRAPIAAPPKQRSKMMYEKLMLILNTLEVNDELFKHSGDLVYEDEKIRIHRHRRGSVNGYLVDVHLLVPVEGQFALEHVMVFQVDRKQWLPSLNCYRPGNWEDHIDFLFKRAEWMQRQQAELIERQREAKHVASFSPIEDQSLFPKQPQFGPVEIEAGEASQPQDAAAEA